MYTTFLALCDEYPRCCDGWASGVQVREYKSEGTSVILVEASFLVKLFVMDKECSMRAPKLRSYGTQPLVRSYDTHPSLHDREGTFASVL